MAKRPEPDRTSSDVLKEFLDVPGVHSVAVLGRDGFLIEALGSDRASWLELETLGAAVATMLNSVDTLGKELAIQEFQDLFIQYGQAVLIVIGMEDVVLAIVSPNASTLGIIRYHARKLLPQLKKFY